MACLVSGHGHVTALIRTNKAYVKGLTLYLTVFFFFILIVMYMVLFKMEFASLESKIHITRLG